LMFIEGFEITVDEAVSVLPPGLDPLRYVELRKTGPISIEFYAPLDQDVQTPHDLDEIYVVISGSGVFLNGEHRSSFRPGDLLFVPARREHRFEEFTADFKAWVFFFDCGA
jgi:mannose-6-phosphate isomerase-like protein (cupin superfamily)